mmetsp:Transcript_11251/g.27661  ORF Transcript_11251/g.27661 Transcript_11251/m.27661 type:complete len:82 (+) Transcript_11251:111-356(+)
MRIYPAAIAILFVSSTSAINPAISLLFSPFESEKVMGGGKIRRSSPSTSSDPNIMIQESDKVEVQTTRERIRCGLLRCKRK